MLFNFQLCPFNQIPPWGTSGKSPLSWYWLTYGCYWLDAGGAALLRYSQPLVALWARKYPSAIWAPGMPYVDYQVERFWDDVIEILPAVLEPVPPRLACTLGLGGQWSVWQQGAASSLNTCIGASLTLREARNMLYDAGRWWGKRHLDTAYLQAGAEIHIWSDGSDVHIEWDNRDLMLEDILAWDAQIGEHRMPKDAYLDEVYAFDARFIRRMHDRVALAQMDWTRPDVTLDPGINATHEANAKWLNERMMPGVRREPDDWDAIFRAIERIQALMPAGSPRLL